MQFDDRLATVLRSGAASERAARTQFRQLLDLLGSAAADAEGSSVLAAYARLAEIGEILPASEQSRILREPGLRLRNPRLAYRLTQGEPQVAAAAMAVARLSEPDWLDLIPDLPMTARGFLRHRRDLPEGARQMLVRLGVRDLVLPQPPGFVPTPPPQPDTEGGIGALVRRIEAFQQARRMGGTASPSMPLGEPAAETATLSAFDFSTDSTGRIDWADPHVAPLLTGLSLTTQGGEALCDEATLRAWRRRMVIHGARFELPGADTVAGEWRVEATPRFDPKSGVFLGYAGRMRRPFRAEPERDTASERMRQVLHELRTPVNAIQGFAEIIQQQLFGQAPNTYRALAGAIGVDAAKLLAGFDEIDRLARLESGALALSDAGGNFRLVVEGTLRRLEGVTRPRSAHLRLLTSGEQFAVGLGEGDCAMLAWRLLATLAGSLAPGEIVELALRGSETGVELTAELPLSVAGEDDLFATGARNEPPAVTAGMFGTGFTMRLARAEAEAAGGSLVREGETLILSLPALTSAAGDHSQGGEGGASPAG